MLTSGYSRVTVNFVLQKKLLREKFGEGAVQIIKID